MAILSHFFPNNYTFTLKHVNMYLYIHAYIHFNVGNKISICSVYSHWNFLILSHEKYEDQKQACKINM